METLKRNCNRRKNEQLHSHFFLVRNFWNSCFFDSRFQIKLLTYVHGIIWLYKSWKVLIYVISIIDFWIESEWVLLCINVTMEAAIYSMKNDLWDQQSACESGAVEKIAKYWIHYHLWVMTQILWGRFFSIFLCVFLSKHFYWFLTSTDIIFIVLWWAEPALQWDYKATDLSKKYEDDFR